MEDFVRNMHDAFENTNKLRELISDCIDYEKPYASKEQLSNLANVIEMNISCAFFYIPTAKEVEGYKNRLCEQEKMIENLKKQVMSLAGTTSLTFAEIAEARKRLDEKAENQNENSS